MDTARFDRIASVLARAEADSDSSTRRSFLNRLGVLAFGIGGLSLLGVEESEAGRKKRRKRRKNKKKKRKNKNQNGNGNERCLNPGDFCSSDHQCCTETTKYICAVSSYASNSDKTCCGGTGAVCGPQNSDGDYLAPHCCAGYQCFYNTGSSTGICQRLEDAQ